MTITPSTIYWIGNCNSIITACILLAILSAILGLAGFCSAMEARCDSSGTTIALTFIPIFLLSVAGAVFVPSTKTAAAMYVIPAIVNNEKMQTLGNGLYDIAIEWMKELKPKDSKDK